MFDISDSIVSWINNEHISIGFYVFCPGIKNKLWFVHNYTRVDMWTTQIWNAIATSNSHQYSNKKDKNKFINTVFRSLSGEKRSSLSYIDSSILILEF